jgi:hypothetical protein
MLLRGFGFLTAVALAFILAELIKRRRKAIADMFARWESFDENAGNKSVREMYLYALKLLKSAKLAPRSGESPLAFAQRVGDGLVELMPLFEKVEFGESTEVVLTEGEYSSVYGYVSELHEQFRG